MKFFLQIILKQQDTDSPKILFDSNKKSEHPVAWYGIFMGSLTTYQTKIPRLNLSKGFAFLGEMFTYLSPLSHLDRI